MTADVRGVISPRWPGLIEAYRYNMKPSMASAQPTILSRPGPTIRR